MDLKEPIAFKTVDGQSNGCTSNANSVDSDFSFWLQGHTGFAISHERTASTASWACLTKCSPVRTSWVGQTNKVSTDMQFSCKALIL